MEDNNIQLNRIKQSVLNELKQISLSKKDRDFLLALIELFDWLSVNEDERFLAKLEKLASLKNMEDDEEFKIRMCSLKTQLDANKNLKIMHLATFSLYFQTEKVEIYIKKLPASWDNLLGEIDKIEFNYMLVNVYKSVTKKDKLVSAKITKKTDNIWKINLEKILNEHIHTNIKITLFYKKKEI